MNFFWLDASAYAKRYVEEKGTQLVNYLFTRVSLERMICLFDGGGEVIFVFVRRRNEELLTFNPETDLQTSLDVLINSP